MSHSFLIVIVPNKWTARAEIIAEVDRLMAPYDARKDRREVKERCVCVGSKAYWELRKQVELEMGIEPTRRCLPPVLSSETTLESFLLSLPPKSDLPEEDRRLKEDEKRRNISSRPRYLRIKVLLETHPLKNAPEPSCELCHGSGTYSETGNPQGNWDGRVIGGYFSGRFTGYNPFEDMENAEPCWLCKAERIGAENLSIEPHEQVVAAIASGVHGMNGKRSPCPVCKDVGFAVPLPSQRRPYEQDILRVSQVPRDVIPYALLTPEGQWINTWSDFEDFDLYLVTPEDEIDEAWEKKILGMYAKYKDHLAVAVDIH